MNGLDVVTEQARIQLKAQMRYAHDNDINLHPQRCGRCIYKGTMHEAEFIGLQDEDGGKLLNMVMPDSIVAMLWVNFNGCKTYKYKGDD